MNLASARSLVALIYVSFFLFATTHSDSILDSQFPRGQFKPPKKLYSAEETAKSMAVSDGFVVEVVAAAQDIANSGAMTADKQGRFWETESFEYP